MMIERSPKLIWGVVSIGIYLFVVGILVFYFNTRNETKPKHYVKKNENRIQVALSSPTNLQKKQKKTTKPKTKIKPKVKPKSKKIIKKKIVKKKPIKKKIVKKKVIKKKIEKKKTAKKKIVRKKDIKKKDVNLTKTTSQKTTDLFAKIKTPKIKKPIPHKNMPKKVKTKLNSRKMNAASASKRISDSIKKQKISDRGEENAYFSKVEKMLKDWPARSDFLGEEAIVELSIKPTGRFRYKVKSSTDNMHFKNSIVAFLKQLQKIGFGRHNAGRTYEFKVEFTTKQ